MSLFSASMTFRRSGLSRRTDDVEAVLVVSRPGVPRRRILVAADHVHVEDGDSLVERNERPLDVLEGAQQAALFRLEDDEQDRPLRPLRRACERPRDLQHARCTTGVVVSAVVDAIAAHADVIVVRGDGNRLGAERRVAAFEQTDHVAGLHDAALGECLVHRHPRVRHGKGCRFAGRVDPLLELLDRSSRGPQQLAGRFPRNREHRQIEIARRQRVAWLAGRPGAARRHGRPVRHPFVDDQHAGGAVLPRAPRSCSGCRRDRSASVP